MYNQYQSYGTQEGEGFFSALLIRTGLAQDSAGARNILIIVSVLCLVIAGFMLYKMNGTQVSTITQEQIDITLKNSKGAIQR